MAEEQGVNVPIRSTFDASGTNAAAQGLKETGAAADVATEATDRMKDAAIGLAEALGVVVSFTALLEFLKDSTQEFYENEKSMRAVNAAIDMFGDKSITGRKAVEDWINSMARLGGVADKEVASALGRAYMLTGNLEQAQSRVGLAMDIATKYGVSFGQGLEILNAALNGQSRALKDFIPHIRDYTDAHQVSAVAIDFLEKNIRGATIAVNDNVKAADQAKVRWQQLKEEIGGSVAPVITTLRNVLLTIPQTLTLISDLSVVMFDSIKRNASALASFLTTVWKHPIDAVKQWSNERIVDEILTNAAVEKAYAQNVKEFLAGEAAKTDAAKKAAETRVQSNLTEATQTLRVTNTLEQQIVQRREWERLQYLKNQTFMQQEGAKSAAEAILNMAKEDAVNEEYHQKALERAREYQKVKKQLALQELRMQKEIADAAMGALTDAFGQSKELSIAQAIISTYEGATKALAQGGIYGAVLAAVVIAAGLAQVAKIESTEPATSSGGGGTSGGFDDPQSDRMAYMTGRKWAKDMVGELSSGWSDGLAGSRGGSSVTNNNVDNSRRTTINANIQDPGSIESVKKLVRTIRMVDQNVLGQTTIAVRTK